MPWMTVERVPWEVDTGGVMACIFFILLLPALYITVSLSEKCHTRVCLQKKRKKREKKRKKILKWRKKENEVSSCLASRTPRSAPWRSVVRARVCVCVQTLHIKITRHVNVSCKLTKRRDELEDEPNRTRTRQDRTTGSTTSCEWRWDSSHMMRLSLSLPLPPCHALPRFRGLSNCLQPDWGTQDDTHPSWMHSLLRLNECEPDYDIHLGVLVGWLCRGAGEACSESQFCLFCGFSAHRILNCFS